MPEILTKHPDIVIKVLKSEGALCGTGATPKILTKCPSDKFCMLHGGELCVYGSNELGQMTQLAPTDVCKSSSEKAPTTGAVAPPTSEPEDVLIGAAPIAIAILAVGLVGLGQRAAVERLRRYRRG